MSILLSDIFNPQSIKLGLEGKTKKEVFAELTGIIAAAHPGCGQAPLLEALWEREHKLSTGIAPGIAIPHAFCGGIEGIGGALGVSQEGIEYDALDSEPVYVVFMLAIGEPAKEHHLRVLNQIFALTQSEALEMIRNAKSPQDVQAILSRFR